MQSSTQKERGIPGRKVNTLAYSLLYGYRVAVSDLKSKYLNSSGTATTKKLKRLGNGEYGRVRVQLDRDEDATVGYQGEVIYVLIENLRVINQVDPTLDVDALKSLPGPTSGFKCDFWPV